MLTPPPDQEIQDGTTERSREPQADSQGGARVAQDGAREGTQNDGRRDSTPSSVQGQDTGLTSYTAQEATQQIEAKEQADKDRAAADTKADADADAKAAREARDIASHPEASADT